MQRRRRREQHERIQSRRDVDGRAARRRVDSELAARDIIRSQIQNTRDAAARRVRRVQMCREAAATTVHRGLDLVDS